MFQQPQSLVGPALTATDNCLPLTLICVLLTDVVSQPQLSVTAQLRDSVTLHCSVFKTHPMTLAWLKQDVGQMPRYIATLSKYSQEMELQDEFKDGRFTVQNTSKSFDLQISHIRSSDVAVYYCAAFMYRRVACGNGTLLLLKVSGSVSRRVEQQPASVPVQPGDSVTLQCTIHTETCTGEHSVHWFRHGSEEALPGLIYTHGNRSDPCESSSEPGLPAQGCVYELPKRNLRSSDAGTYYCAVATCGQILFGNGTWLEFAAGSWLAGAGVVAVWALAGLGLVSLALLAVLAFRVWSRHRAARRADLCQIAEDFSLPTSAETTSSQDAEVTYTTVELGQRGRKHKQRRREQEQVDGVVYTDIRYHHRK
ncbi:signal-regulatory protein beta-2-like [Amia ocellicauda]|uniref:signal-regulatory protein beta-2-like n=1 Tax=Amia ocellicauda TaxID=2972642 RepID=UPI003464BA78